LVWKETTGSLVSRSFISRASWSTGYKAENRVLSIDASKNWQNVTALEMFYSIQDNVTQAK